MDPAAIKLAEASERIAISMEQLALVSSANTSSDYLSQSYSYNDQDLPSGWVQQVTLVGDFNGDLFDFLEMLSAVAGMKPPRMDDSSVRRPVIVSIRGGSRKLISYLADAGYQAGDYAIVRPVAELNQVLIEYKR